MMTKSWYYQRHNQTHGPYSESEMEDLASRGLLGPADLVWRDGTSEWITAVQAKFVPVSAPSPDRTSSLPPNAPPLPNQSVTGSTQTASNPIPPPRVQARTNSNAVQPSQKPYPPSSQNHSASSAVPVMSAKRDRLMIFGIFAGLCLVIAILVTAALAITYWSDENSEVAEAPSREIERVKPPAKPKPSSRVEPTRTKSAVKDNPGDDEVVSADDFGSPDFSEKGRKKGGINASDYESIEEVEKSFAEKSKTAEKLKGSEPKSEPKPKFDFDTGDPSDAKKADGDEKSPFKPKSEPSVIQNNDGKSKQNAKQAKQPQQKQQAKVGGKGGGKGRPNTTLKNQNQHALIQNLSVTRKPSFVVSGVPINQNVQFTVTSRMTVGAVDENGHRVVEQEILKASLVAADPLSKAAFTTAIAKLPGKVYRFELNEFQEVVKFDGHEDGKKVNPFEGLGGKGFAVSSVMDKDAWKEMAQLSFFHPEDSQSKWDRQMSHDWDTLGSWNGLTKYQKGRKRGKMLPVRYAHEMKYTPPRGGAMAAGMAFNVDDAVFRPLEARGEVRFDADRNQVDRIKEIFHVQGIVNSEVLGQKSTIKIEEFQEFTLILQAEK